MLKDDELLIVGGKVESVEGVEITLIADSVQRLHDAVPSRAQNVSITLPETGLDEKSLEEIFAMLSSRQGKCDVFFNLPLGENLSVCLVSQPLRVNGTRNLENELNSRGCLVQWQLG